MRQCEARNLQKVKLILYEMFVGSVTVGDIVGTLPFQNTIDIVELRGEDIIRMLEHSASVIGNPRFLQVSGALKDHLYVRPC